MSDGPTTRTITVADVSGGPGGDGTAPGASVSLPVVELLTGRGFVTGKSGSGKSNTASVVAERLLDDGYPLLIVDVEGEYYGLKEEYELLHAGADDECDIQVAPEHAEKLASLALEQNVPIVLDVSGYLDEAVADELVFETARHLFAKEKKLKQPFLLLVEEVHEYIPEGGGTTDAGRMLVKIGKRGRKHGLGLLGISQRPANVKKDYITQCDWLCWHRLTWDNDTQVVRRIIDREHAEAVEDLDDGEAFLMTDWSESIRRVQFHRKRTFDAGATPASTTSSGPS
ncbi:MAG: putative ATPase [uncultured archaeon A07HB70]|nr:MAG: putative ATPase [uncultured archaeon A07HB70]